MLLLPAAAAIAQAWHAEDRSKPVSWYVKRGAPSPDRAWSPADYEQFELVLSAVAPIQLPRLRSQLSGPLFRRSIDLANLEIVRSAPSAARVSLLVGYTEPSRQIFGIYLGPTADGLVFDDEIVGLMGFMVALSELIAAESEALLAALPADDPSRPTREAGLRQIKSGLATMVFGAFTTIGEREAYRDPARADLVAYLQKYLPRLFRHLSDTQRIEALTTLRRLEGSEKNSDLERALAETRMRLE